LRTLGSQYSPTRRGVVGDADARCIAGHATASQDPRVVFALRTFIAFEWFWPEASAGWVLVRELAVAEASVEVRAGRRIGDAGHVCRARRDPETTSEANVAPRSRDRDDGDG